MEQRRPGTAAVLQGRGMCDRAGTGAVDVSPPCPTADGLPSSQFSSPQLSPQKPATSALGQPPFKSLDRVLSPVPTVLLACPFPQVPAPPPCRGTGGAAPARPSAPLTAYEPRRRQQPQRQLREAHPGRAGAARDGHSAAEPRQLRAADPGRWEPLGTAGNCWEPPGAAGAPAPPAARPLPAAAAELSLRRRRPGRNGAERRDADGPPPRPASRLMDFPPFPDPRASPGRRAGSGAARSCCGSRNDQVRLGEGSSAL